MIVLSDYVTFYDARPTKPPTLDFGPTIAPTKSPTSRKQEHWDTVTAFCCEKYLPLALGCAKPIARPMDDPCLLRDVSWTAQAGAETVKSDVTCDEMVDHFQGDPCTFKDHTKVDGWGGLHSPAMKAFLHSSANDLCMCSKQAMHLKAYSSSKFETRLLANGLTKRGLEELLTANTRVPTAAPTPVAPPLQTPATSTPTVVSMPVPTLPPTRPPTRHRKPLVECFHAFRKNHRVALSTHAQQLSDLLTLERKLKSCSPPHVPRIPPTQRRSKNESESESIEASPTTPTSPTRRPTTYMELQENQMHMHFAPFLQKATRHICKCVSKMLRASFHTEALEGVDAKHVVVAPVLASYNMMDDFDRNFGSHSDRDTHSNSGDSNSDNYKVSTSSSDSDNGISTSADKLRATRAQVKVKSYKSTQCTPTLL